MGAIQAGDRRSTEAQRKWYDEAVQELCRTATDVSASIDRAIYASRQGGPFDAEMWREQVVAWQEKGVGRGRLRKGFQLELSKRALAHLDACARAPHVATLVLRGVEDNLQEIREQTLRAAGIISRERHRVTGSKTFRARPRRRS